MLLQIVKLLTLVHLAFILLELPRCRQSHQDFVKRSVVKEGFLAVDYRLD
jgi:hypothetical protein